MKNKLKKDFNEQIIKATFSDCLDPIIICDKDFNIFEANKTAINKLNLSLNKKINLNSFLDISKLPEIEEYSEIELDIKNEYFIYPSRVGIKKLYSNENVYIFKIFIKEITEKQNLEQVYKDIFENVCEGICTLDSNGNINNCNKAAYEIFDLKPNQNLNICIKDIVYKEDIEKLKKYYQDLIKNGYYKGFKCRIMSQKGKIKHVEVNSTAIYDKTGNFIGSRDIVHDITLRTEQERRYRILFDYNSSAIASTNKEGYFLEINKAFLETFGYSKEELKKLKVSDLTIKKSKKINNEDLLEFENNKINNFSIKKSYLAKDGKVIEANVKVSKFFDINDNLIESIATIENITQKIELEKKYKDLFENINETILNVDKEWKISHYNKSIYKILEIEEGKKINIDITDIIYKEDIKKAKSCFKKLKKNGFYNKYQGRVVTNKGNIKYVEVDSTAIYDRNNKFVGSRSIVRDITKNKFFEKSLKENKIKHNNIFENSSDAIMIVDIEKKKILECNKKTYKFFKYEDINDENLRFFLFNITSDKFSKYYEKTIENNKFNFESYYVNNEKIIYFQTTFSKIYEDNNNLISISFKNITLEKKIDEALEKAFNKKVFQTEKEFFDNLTISISALVPNDFILIGEIDQKKQEINTKSLFYNSKIQENVIYKIKNSPCESVFKTKKKVSIRNDVQSNYPKDNDLKLWDVNSYVGFPLFISKEKIYGNLVVLCKKEINIEEEKLTNKILKIFSNKISSEIERIKNILEIIENKEKYLTLYNSTSFGIAICNENFKITNANKTFCNYFGYSNKEIINESISSLTSSEYINKTLELLNKIVKKEELNFTTTTKYIKRDNSTFIGNVFVSGLYNKNRKFKEAIILIEDMTPKLEIQKKLRINENSLNEAQKISKVGSWEYNLKTKKLKWSKNLYELFEVKQKEKISLSQCAKFVPEEFRDRVLNMVESPELYKYEDSFDFEKLNSKGEKYYFKLKAKIIFDNNKPVKYSGTIQDITDIKIRDEKLKNYSFMNSHKVRKPLANILSGLELIKGIPEIEKYTKLIEISAHELDEIVSQINSELNI